MLSTFAAFFITNGLMAFYRYTAGTIYNNNYVLLSKKKKKKKKTKKI
jgi:hypothetical protein